MTNIAKFRAFVANRLAEDARKILHANPNSKIDNIKGIRDITGLGLKDSKDIIESCSPGYINSVYGIADNIVGNIIPMPAVYLVDTAGDTDGRDSYIAHSREEAHRFREWFTSGATHYSRPPKIYVEDKE